MKQRVKNCGWCVMGGWLAVVLAASGGCEEQPPPPAVETAAAAPTAAPSPWRTLNRSSQVAVPDEADDRELSAAIGRAQATADEARQRWRATPTDERGNWAVKWAAPTVDGRVEHVWVEPVTWSRFRIEGRLASPPHDELLCAKGHGELVSFAAEELSDWVYLVEGRIDGQREGGFTIQLLERRYGQPK